MNPEQLIATARAAVQEGLARISATLNYNFYVSSTRKGQSGNNPTKRYLRLTIKFTRADGKKSTLISPTIKEMTLEEAKAIKPLLSIAEGVLNREAAAAAPLAVPPVVPTQPLSITVPAPTAPGPVVAPAPVTAPIIQPEPIAPKLPYFLSDPDLGTLVLDVVPIRGLGYHDHGVNDYTQFFPIPGSLTFWRIANRLKELGIDPAKIQPPYQ